MRRMPLGIGWIGRMFWMCRSHAFIVSQTCDFIAWTLIRRRGRVVAHRAQGACGAVGPSVVRCRRKRRGWPRWACSRCAFPRVAVSLVGWTVSMSRVVARCGTAGRGGSQYRRAFPPSVVSLVAEPFLVSCGVVGCGVVGVVGWSGWCVGGFRHAGVGLCLLGFGGVGWGATRRWVAWVVGVGVGFLLAAAHGLPGCPGGFGGCVWWFENSIVCTVLYRSSREGFQRRAMPRVVASLVVAGDRDTLGGVLCLLGFGGVGWVATRRGVAWVVGVGVGFLLAAAHGLPGCPGGFGGCVWWFDNSIVCTLLLHHAAMLLVVWWSFDCQSDARPCGTMLLVVWWSFDCQSDARPCGTRGGLMGVGVFV